MNGTWEQSDHYDMRKGVNFYWDWHKVIYTMQLLKWFKVQVVYSCRGEVYFESEK